MIYRYDENTSTEPVLNVFSLSLAQANRISVEHNKFGNNLFFFLFISMQTTESELELASIRFFPQMKKNNKRLIVSLVFFLLFHQKAGGANKSAGWMNEPVRKEYHNM